MVRHYTEKERGRGVEGVVMTARIFLLRKSEYLFSCGLQVGCNTLNDSVNSFLSIVGFLVTFKVIHR